MIGSIFLCVIFIIILYFNEKKSCAIIVTDMYPELYVLQNNFETILKELHTIIRTEKWTMYDKLHNKNIFSNDTNVKDLKNILYKNSEKILNNKNWKIYGLIYNKNIICDTCTKTISLLKSCNPQIINAAFSCLEAGKITDLHSDDNVNTYRYHLPMIVPNGNTGISIDNVTIKYKKNIPFIFDDGYKHQAWNLTQSFRIVLIVDVVKKL